MSTVQGRLRIAVQKSGRLAERSLDLVRDAGLRVVKGTNDLLYRVENYPIDLLRVRDYLDAHTGDDAQLVLVGFGDAKSDPSRARLLSRLRAETVRRALSRLGVTHTQVLGIGDDLPVADNQAESGRIRNRRVEVWVR